MKQKARRLLDKIKGTVSWNDRGEMVYRNVPVPGSNIVDLVNDALRKRKSFQPVGWKMFARGLKAVNAPMDLIGNPECWIYIQTTTRRAYLVSPPLYNTCDGIRIKQSRTTSRCYYVMAGRGDNKSLSNSRILNSIYYDTQQTGRFWGIDRLRRASHPTLRASAKEVKQWLSVQDTYTLYKPVRYRFRRRRVVGVE